MLDTAALISAMASVDLNPVRANLAQPPEQADHTCIQIRLQDADKTELLKPFSGTKNLMDTDPITCDFDHYVYPLD